MGEPVPPEQPSTSSCSAVTGGTKSEAMDLSDPVLASMTADELKKFIDTGRTGRRNAVSDVSQAEAVAGTSASGVADALEALSVKDEDGAGSSKGS